MSKKSLLNQCPVCKGQGYTRQLFTRRKITCTACGGTGYLIRWIVPTNNGGRANE